MEKKAKIIATLGPAIYSNTKLKQLVDLGVDAFRINFSHKTQGINRIVSRIRKIEKYILDPHDFLIGYTKFPKISSKKMDPSGTCWLLKSQNLDWSFRNKLNIPLKNLGQYGRFEYN